MMAREIVFDMGFLNFELFFFLGFVFIELSMYSLMAVNKMKDLITVNVEEAEEKSHLIIAILGEKRTRVD